MGHLRSKERVPAVGLFLWAEVAADKVSARKELVGILP